MPSFTRDADRDVRSVLPAQPNLSAAEARRRVLDRLGAAETHLLNRMVRYIDGARRRGDDELEVAYELGRFAERLGGLRRLRGLLQEGES